MNIQELKNNQDFIDEMEKSDKKMVKPIAREISAFSTKVTKKRLIVQEKANMLAALRKDANDKASFKQRMGVIHLQNFMPLLAIPVLLIVIYVTVGSLFMSLAGVSGEKTWQGVRNAMSTDYRWIMIALSALAGFMFIINTFSFGFQKFYHEFYQTIFLLRVLQIVSSIFTNHLYVVTLNETYASKNMYESGFWLGWFAASMLEIISFAGSQLFTLLVYRLYDLDNRVENTNYLYKIMYIVKAPICLIIDAAYKFLYERIEGESVNKTKKTVNKNLLDTHSDCVYEDDGIRLDNDASSDYSGVNIENIEEYEEILRNCEPDQWITKDTFGLTQPEWRRLRDRWCKEKKVQTRGTRTYKISA